MENKAKKDSDNIRVRILNQERLAIHIPYRPAWVSKIKHVPGKSWISERACWTIPKTRQAVKSFCQQFEGEPVLVLDRDLFEQYPEIRALYSSYENEALRKMHELLRLKGYSEKTLHAYMGHAR